MIDILVKTRFQRKELLEYHYTDNLIMAPYHLMLLIYRTSHQSYLFFLDFIHISRNE